MPLHHSGGRIPVEAPDRPQPSRVHFGGQVVGPDDQHPSASNEPLGQQPRRRLGAGDHIVTGRGEAEFGQMRGDNFRSATGIVRDVHQPLLRLPSRCQRLRRPRDDLVTAVQRAVQIQQQG